MQQKTLKYPSKARYLHAPAKLAEAIEAINLITSEFDKRFDEIEPYSVGLTDEWADFYGSLPEAVKKFVRDISDKKDYGQLLSEESYLWLYEGYQNLLFFRHFLASLRETHEKAVADSNNDSEKYIAIMKKEFYRLTNPDTGAYGRKRVVNSLEDDPNRRFSNVLAEFSPASVFNFEPHPVLKILKNVEFRRIRQCLLCKNLFWAKRLNAFGCSPKCSNTLRQRRLREKNKKD